MSNRAGAQLHPQPVMQKLLDPPPGKTQPERQADDQRGEQGPHQLPFTERYRPPRFIHTAARFAAVDMPAATANLAVEVLVMA
jgi:hypothetical protein